MKKIRSYKPFWISFTRYIRHMSSRMKIPEYLFLGDRKTLESYAALCLRHRPTLHCRAFMLPQDKYSGLSPSKSCKKMYNLFPIEYQKQNIMRIYKDEIWKVNYLKHFCVNPDGFPIHDFI